MKNIIYSLFGIILISTVGDCKAMMFQQNYTNKEKEQILEQIQDIFPRVSSTYKRIGELQQLKHREWTKEDEQDFMSLLTRPDVRHHLSEIAEDKKTKEQILGQIQDVFPQFSSSYKQIQGLKQRLQEGKWTDEDKQDFRTLLDRDDVKDHLKKINDLSRSSAKTAEVHQERISSQISPEEEQKGRIIEQIQDVFPSNSSTYEQIKGLKQQLQQEKWTKYDEEAFRKLLDREDVQHHLGEIDKASAKTTEGCQKRTSSRISSEEEERLTRELLEKDGTLARYQQEKKDAQMARLLQNEEKGRRNVRKIENRLPASSGTLAMDLRNVVEAFFKIVGKKNDFDVHQFDPLFGMGNDIASPNCKTVLSYLKAVVPPERAMTLQEIQRQMEQDLNKCSLEFMTGNDLSIQYLNHAFDVLSHRHQSLIDLFRQVYTMINRYAPDWRQGMLVSFVSNVNKFKGQYCYQGFRNRILSMFCLVYGHIHLGKK